MWEEGGRALGGKSTLAHKSHNGRDQTAAEAAILEQSETALGALLLPIRGALCDH